MSKAQPQHRKSHIKSKLGCSACKQRHQKCDENRPSCVNCTTAHRHCPYLDIQSESEDSSYIVPSVTTRPNSQSTGDFDGASVQPIKLVLQDELEDLLYIELLQQWLCQTYSTCVGPKEKTHRFGLIVFNHALNSPFLMRSVLALAALHKASLVDTTRQQKFLDVSEKLQAEGLANFNTIVSNLNAETIIPAFLFAFITGIHRLCQVSLSARQRDQLLPSLIDAMVFLRGVSTIITGWMEHLRASELGILMAGSETTDNLTNPTDHLETLSRLRIVVQMTNPDHEAFDTYSKVIDGLQVLIGDMQRQQHGQADNSIGVIVVWMIMIPSEFTTYLRQGRPEALVILAHSVPLFHYKRHFWGIRDIGPALVNAVSSQLPDTWQSLLEWPRSFVTAE